MAMGLRTKRACIRLVFHALVMGTLLLAIGLGSLIGHGALAHWSMLFLLIYGLTVRRNPLPGLIERAAIKEHRCNWCQNKVPLKAPWQCSNCRFLPRERHAFSVCPGCKKSWEYIECPYDGTVIPI